MSKAITYDNMSQSDLLDLAAKRGVQALEHYRKPDLKQLLQAMDDKDQKAAQAVIDSVAARAEALKNPPAKQSLADKIMKKAQETSGQAIAHRPKADAAQAKADATSEPPDELAVQAKKSEERRVSAAKTTIPIGAPGEDIVAAMKARSAAARAQPAVNTLVPSNKALDAVRFAHTHNESMHGIKPSEGLPPNVKVFEVIEDGTYFSRTGTYQLKKGSVVTETTHDMESIQLHGVKLREIDPTKTEIVYSNLGTPLSLKTTAMEAKGG